LSVTLNLPFFGSHGHQGRHDEVEGEHRLVDLAPEGPALRALLPLARFVRGEEVRQRIGEDHHRRGVDDVLAEQQEGERRGEEHDTRQRKLEMQHRVQVAEPLGEAEARPEQRIVDPHDLGHATRPARTLADVQ